MEGNRNGDTDHAGDEQSRKETGGIIRPPENTETKRQKTRVSGSEKHRKHRREKLSNPADKNDRDQPKIRS